MDNRNFSVGEPGDIVSFVTLKKSIRSGEQGQTWLASAANDDHLLFVVKICKTQTGTAGTSVDEFKRECKVLAELGHPKIVKIINYGEGFLRGDKPQQFPFYVMENLGSNAVTLSDALANPDIPATTKLLFSLCALRDAASALAQVHAKGFYHGDIKESNILICDPQSKVPEIRLIDFGFSDRLVPEDQGGDDDVSGPQKLSSIRRRVKARTKQHADLFQLCFMVNRCLLKCPDPKSVEEHEKQNWPINTAAIDHLRRLLSDWAAETPNSKPDVAEISDFYDELATLTKSYELPPDARGAVKYLSIQEIVTAAEIRQAFEAIRIPPRKLVLYTERIHKLITTPQFGALRFVRQLGFTHLVYPGAQGTRFEHSLGMYDLACHFIIRMSGHEAFQKWCESQHDVLKFIVAALLHDVGHFPFAHQLEEFSERDFEPHDRERVRRLISGHLYRGRQVIDELGRVLRYLFNFAATDIEDIKWLAFGQDKEGPSRTPAPALSFLRELLDGPIDLDKLDYIERDAHHCGVPYGNYLDVSRIIETMRVVEGRKGGPILAFDSRIVGSLEQFATARHELYANVYWHRAVRSATAMFKHAFYLFQELMADEEGLKGLFYQTLSDDCVLYRMNEWTARMESNRACDAQTRIKARAILELLRAISGRERILYKEVLQRDRDKVRDKAFGAQYYRDQREEARGIFRALGDAGFLIAPGEDSLGEHNLLIENRFDQFPFFDDIQIQKGPSEELISLGAVAPSVKYLRENFSAQACKIRVFVNPNALKPEFQSKAGRAVVRKHLEGMFPEVRRPHL